MAEKSTQEESAFEFECVKALHIIVMIGAYVRFDHQYAIQKNIRDIFNT